MDKYIGKEMFAIPYMCESFSHKRMVITNGYIEKIEDINRFTEYVVDGVVLNSRQFYPMLVGDNITHREKVLMHNLFRYAMRTEDRCLTCDLYKWADLAGEKFVPANKEEWTKSGLKGLYK